MKSQPTFSESAFENSINMELLGRIRQAKNLADPKPKTQEEIKKQLWIKK